MMLKKSLYLFPAFIVLSVILFPGLSGGEDQYQPALQAVNRAPVAWPQSVATREDTPKAITLKGTDADGDPLTYVFVSEPLHGTLSGSGPNVIYTPVANYFGSDSFTFKVNDGQVDSKIAKVSIAVRSVNDPPVAFDQTITTLENTPAAITLSASDTDGTRLTYKIVQGSSQGTLTGTGPNRTYTPAANYKGQDQFTFSVNDGRLNSNVATVSITVMATNHAPLAESQSVSTSEDSARAITLAAADADGDPLIYTIVSGPMHGALTGIGPNVTYRPVLNYYGPDSFTFKVSDSQLESNVAAISITVVSVNDPPVAFDQSVTTAEDTSKTITLSATDVEGDTLTYQIVAGPVHGTLTGSGPTRTYMPAGNYFGPDNFTFKVNDGQTDSNIATVSITVTGVNDPPAAKNQTITMDEDTTKAITLEATDPDGDPLIYSIVASPSHGTLSGAPPNLTYTPTLNYNGSDSFTFKANDRNVDSNVATVSITVTPVNDAPVAQNQSITMDEDTAKGIVLSATDADGDNLVFQVLAQPQHGTLGGIAPNLTYIPATNYNGSDTFTFKANDGKTDSNIATVSITVTPINDPPVAQNQSITIDEDTQKTITLTATDTDGDNLVFQILAQPQHGTLSGTPPSVVYTPASNYHGPDSFSFKTKDGNADSNVATVSITINPVNDFPVAQGQTVTTDEDAPKALILTATDVDGDILTFVVVSPPAHGTLNGTPPNVIYTPAANYHGSDTFTFKANDGKSDSGLATVSITISPVNDAPVADNQSATAAEDTSKDILLSGRDGDGDQLTYTIVSPPSHGTLTGSGANRVYTPASNYHGSDSFTFKVNDGMMDSGPATVSITVTSVNDAPVAQNQSVTTNENTPKIITLSATDADGDPLTYAVVSQPAHGSLSGSGPNLTYTPNPNYYGPDSFTFKASDGQAVSNVATVSITVSAVNDAPVAQNQNLTVEEDTPKQITFSATDADGDALTFTIVSRPLKGTLTGAGAIWTYAANLNYQGPDAFTFKANDGQVDSNIATVSITVTPVNDPPVAQDQNVATDEDIAKAITLAATDTEGESLTYQVLTQPAHGALSGTPPSLTYTPSANYHGSDSFTFKSSDGKAESNVATVSITINPVNDPPVAENQNVTTDENTPKAILLSATDVDGGSLAYQIVTQPAHGTLNGTPPNVSYAPAANYGGPDSFTFKANDGNVDSNIATVSITVKSVNQAPVAQNQSITAFENTAKTFMLVATDSDGDPLTCTIVSGPSHGTLSGTSPTLTYTPAINYTGSDSFTFKVHDGNADSNEATVSITVMAVLNTQIITTIAGNGVPGFAAEDNPAIQAQLYHPESVAVDISGNLYIADVANYRIRKVYTNGIIHTIAGTGVRGSRGDDGLATSAEIDPVSVSVDASENVYISEYTGSRVRKVANGIITTIAGGGESGYGGDGGPAIQAKLDGPWGLTTDASGNLYIADLWNHRVRKVDTNGIITTVAGNGEQGDSGDGGPAVHAKLNNPRNVTVDTNGNLYINDSSNNKIRKVDNTGIITTVAGNGTAGYSGDGGAAIEAKLNYPREITTDLSGNLYIADLLNYRIRKVDTNGVITTVAGDGTEGYSGDGGPAINAQFKEPVGIAADNFGGLYIADRWDHRVRFVKNLFPLKENLGIIVTVAGNGEWGDGGDGGLAVESPISGPEGVATDAAGNLYIAENPRHRIRKVDLNGVITTVAGNGMPGYSGDGVPASQAQLYSPAGVATDAQGNLYISDSWNQRVRKVDRNGMITTVAGNGMYGYSGDNRPATQSKLNQPEGIFVDISGNLYIADSSNYRVRRVDPYGIITTVAGSGERGDGGDGGPATQAKFWYPGDVTADREGNLYIADWGYYVIRKVDKNGIISTVAGNRTKGYSGNGGLATQAQLDGPTSVAVDASGNLYIADNGNHRIRKVDKDGKITTIAGSYMDEMGYGDFWGDGGPAIKAALNFPSHVAVNSSGEVYISDNWNGRIRLITNGRGTITGFVADSSTMQPLSDVIVAAKDSLRTLTGRTDSNGAYTISGLAGGNFTATFTKSGYLKQTVTGTTTGNETVTLNIRLTPIASLVLTITSPQDGATLNQSPITVTGNVTNNANVTVNGIQALVSNNTFSASIPLIEGPNTITASAIDQYDQNVSQTINVTLLSKGSITGLVTDSSTSLPLTGATVSITDSSGNTKTVSTDNNGQYAITDLLFGAFNGTITKACYSEYRISGTLSTGETKTINAALTPIPPTISNVVVSNITKNSATIKWTTDQPASSYVEYGATTSYGSSTSDSTLTTSHTIILTNLLPATLYHFRVSSANEYGFSSTSVDHTFSTTMPPIILIITYPANGATINRRDVMVKGTVINNKGNETGVTVNGVLTMVYGTEFVVNHLPLDEGENTVEAIATDTAGTTESGSITINATTPQEYIKLTANAESAIPPAEITLTIESSLDLTNATLTYTGPSQVEFLSSSLSEYRVGITAEGIYYFTISAKAPNGDPYSDTIAIVIFSEAELDNLLRATWAGMKQAMINKDAEKASSYFAEWSKERYLGIFSALGNHMLQVAQDMQDIGMIYFVDNVAKYRIRRMEEGEEITYYIYFVRDEKGLWKIQQF